MTSPETVPKIFNCAHGAAVVEKILGRVTQHQKQKCEEQ